MAPGDPPPAPGAQPTEDVAAQEPARQALVAAADEAAQATAAAQDRVRAAQEALARERQAAADLEHAAVAARNAAFPPPPDDPDYEAATVANLHTQAAGVQNLHALVPVILDTLSPHYNRWRDLVRLALERYALADHVLSDASAATPSW
jgi:hypothetical protein